MSEKLTAIKQKKVTVKRIDGALDDAREIFNVLDWDGPKANERVIAGIREIMNLLHDMRAEVKQRSNDNRLCATALKKDRRKILKKLGMIS
jgi:hypothetical protein